MRGRAEAGGGVVRGRGGDGATPHPAACAATLSHEGRGSFRYEAANFISLIASKFCTPPPTRLVV